MRLQDRHLIVTGGSQGIGAACAARFVREGASVLVVDLEPMAQAPEHADRTIFVQGDVSQRSCAEQALATALQHWGRVDGLLNNAGIIHGCAFLDLRDEDFDRVLAVNLRAFFIFSQVVARHMVAHRIRGSIVNMSSVNALLAIPDQLPYAVSKGGVNQLTRVSAMALASQGIRVNAVGPGTIATELARKAVLGSEAARRRIMSRTPLLRLGEPDEVAQVAAFLLSEEASYLTGQIVYPDGGRLALNYTTEE